MVFPRFVTETTPMLGPGCSGWTIPLAWWFLFRWWNLGARNRHSGIGETTGKAPKRLTCRIQGRGSSLLEPVTSCWCWRIAGSVVAGGSVVPRVAACGRNRWRSFGCHSADWFWERCPFLAQKWGPFFVKILCQGYVSQLLPIFVYSSRAYVFFWFFCRFLGNANRFSRRYQSGMTVGPAKCIFCFQIARGVDWLITPPLNSYE